jgi:hypothetical protein
MLQRRVFSLLLVLVTSCRFLEAVSLRVGSFSPDVFGKTKFEKDEVMKTFSEVGTCSIL